MQNYKWLCCLLVFIPLSLSEDVGWKLVWHDEFDGDHVNRSNWDYEVNCYGSGNEKQCYVDSIDNVYVKNGVLNIKPIPFPNGYQGSLENCTDNTQNSCTWIQPATSGRIRTLKSPTGSWKYGRFEVYAKMPKGDFLWPAIWMLPTDWVYGGWAASGEIDLMEFRGQDPHVQMHTLHFGAVWPFNRYEGTGEMYYENVDFTNGFHQYAFEWNDKEMRWFIDGVQNYYVSLNRDFYSGYGPDPYSQNGQPFDQRFHLLLNCAVAGDFFDPNRYGKFDPWHHPSTWTQTFQIDYVRVYQFIEK